MPSKLRVSSGQKVHILAHRIDAVARRNASGRAIQRLINRMRQHEAQNVTYTAVLGYLARFTGLVYVYDENGTRYKVHHTDVIRA